MKKHVYDLSILNNISCEFTNIRQHITEETI